MNISFSTPASSSAAAQAAAQAAVQASNSRPGATRAFRALALTIAVGSALSLGLAGCSSASKEPEIVYSTPSEQDAANDEAQQPALALTQGWAKAANAGEMTGLFGELTNTTSAEIVVIGGYSSSANEVELHETIRKEDGTSVMQEAQNGYRIAPGESFLLEPGANHIMLIGLGESLLPGNETVLTLQLEGGTEVELSFPIKAFAGANESYEPGEGHSGGQPADSHEPSSSPSNG